MEITAFIGLGSNQGEREKVIAKAVNKLSTTPGISLVRVSALEETKPVGPIKQPDFINAVACIKTALGPIELLDALLDIERQLGRVRKERGGPRTIDLDILFYGDRIIEHPRLRVPHPEIQNRPFILKELSEVGAWIK